MHQMLRSKKRSTGIIFSTVIVLVILSFLHINAYAADKYIDQARAMIELFYVDEVPRDKLNAPTINEMVNSLNDPYSKYFTVDEYNKFKNSIDMKVSGIGIQIDVVPEGVKVLSVIEGSPAEQAGLKEGDIITRADGHSLAGLPSDQSVSYIKGQEGTSVTITVLRNGTDYNYNIVRKQVAFPTIEGTMIDKHIGYIKIVSFGEDTTDKFRQKLKELDNQAPDSYIIDIRNNGGGYLSTAVEIAGSFIDGKPALITRDRRDGDITYTARGDGKIIDKPVIFLINEYSASASEILAAAVKDYNKAFFIGTNTYGKGTVQAMFQLFEEGVLKLTIQRFYSPLGKTINKVGVSPDFEVKDFDSMQIAELLLGNSGLKGDKSGFVKIKTGKGDFEIDLNKARNPENWEAFKYIIDKSASHGYEIYTGTESGWNRINISYIERLYKLYFPQYKEIPELSSVSADKVFTITFTENIDRRTINSESIQLINAYSGDRVALKFEYVDERRVKVIHDQPLSTGEIYYFVVNNSVKGQFGGNLKEGTITRISVR